MKSHSNVVFKQLKSYIHYNEKKHCPLLLEVMMTTGRYVDFCIQLPISDRKFRTWVNNYELFGECYEVGKMFAFRNWEKEGEEIRDETNPPGVISNRFEHWKMVGWSRFGISRNSRIKLDLNPHCNPSEHYAQLLLQASKGDFTASEIKQLMEAVNVGLSTHREINLQKQIDEIRADQAIMKVNTNGDNTFTNKGITKAD